MHFCMHETYRTLFRSSKCKLEVTNHSNRRPDSLRHALPEFRRCPGFTQPFGEFPHFGHAFGLYTFNTSINFPCEIRDITLNPGAIKTETDVARTKTQSCSAALDRPQKGCQIDGTNPQKCFF